MNYEPTELQKQGIEKILKERAEIIRIVMSRRADSNERWQKQKAEYQIYLKEQAKKKK